MAYSVYLLHGIVLFVTFNFALGLHTSRELSPLKHWLWVMGTTPILIMLCDATYRLVEHPAMRSTNDVMVWLRSGLRLRPWGYAASRKPVDT
jgi:peptidoglycan/LPS O-acetylase OafA/YrhL